MAEHQWWRVLFAASQGGSYIQFAELAFIDEAGTDVSSGGVASASSVYSGGYEAANAFDKNLATDWCTVSGALPAWLAYMHAAPVDVRGFRIRAPSNAAWLPRGVADLTLEYSDNGADWTNALPDDDHELYVVSGQFSANQLIEIQIREKIPLQTGFVGIESGSGRDWRMPREATGTIANNNRVMVKPGPSSPEVPFAGARVRLHRLSDGYCAWEGLSDANGYYWPSGLEVGVEYYPVAIDLSGMHECDAAGPVVAVKGG